MWRSLSNKLFMQSSPSHLTILLETLSGGWCVKWAGLAKFDQLPQSPDTSYHKLSPHQTSARTEKTTVIFHCLFILIFLLYNTPKLSLLNCGECVFIYFYFPSLCSLYQSFLTARGWRYLGLNILVKLATFGLLTPALRSAGVSSVGGWHLWFSTLVLIWHHMIKYWRNSFNTSNLVSRRKIYVFEYLPW